MLLFVHKVSFIIREGPPSYSASIQEPNSENGIKENSAWNENLLTLSLPAITAATSLSSKFNLTFSSQAFHNHNIPDFETNPYEVRLSNKYPVH